MEKEQIIKTIYDNYKRKQEPPRPYLGASELGKHCNLILWRKLRWCSKEDFDGRMLKLFKRGHFEELIMCEDLKSVGIKLEHTGKDQLEVNFCSHGKGHPDGIIKAAKNMLWECKTFNDENFKKLKENGVKESKFEHYIQIQIYLHELNKKMIIEHALYTAINKNDDELYFEIINYDKFAALDHIRKAERIIKSPTQPKCLKCKNMCIENKQILPEHVTCRSCIWIEFAENNICKCNKKNCELSVEDQFIGCDYHIIIPDLVDAIFDKIDDNYTSISYNDGSLVNGAGGLSSRIFLANDIEKKICETFKGEIMPDNLLKCNFSGEEEYLF